MFALGSGYIPALLTAGVFQLFSLVCGLRESKPSGEPKRWADSRYIPTDPEG